MQFSPVLTVEYGLVSEIKSSAVIDKVRIATTTYLELTVTAIKTGPVGINQGHWKLYHWLPT